MRIISGMIRYIVKLSHKKIILCADKIMQKACAQKSSEITAFTRNGN